MIELLIALAPTPYPSVWANDYCVNRGFDFSHDQAVALANTATGEMTPEAWELTKTHNWCIYTNEQEGERN